MATLTERVLTLTDRGMDFPTIAAILDITPQQVEEAWLGNALTRSGEVQVLDIPGEESTKSEGQSLVSLATADELSITVGASGVLAVVYRAMWKQEIDSAVAAAIFIDGVAATRSMNPSAEPVPALGNAGSAHGHYRPLASSDAGLVTDNGEVAYLGNVTDQIIGADTEAAGFRGGPCWITTSPGAHTVGIRFGAHSSPEEPNTLFVKDRQLRVWGV